MHFYLLLVVTMRLSSDSDEPALVNALGEPASTTDAANTDTHNDPNADTEKSAAVDDSVSDTSALLAPSTSPPSPSPSFRIVYRPPGCAEDGSSNLNLMLPVLDAVRGNGVVTSTFGDGVRIASDRIIVNADAPHDAAPVERFLRDDATDVILIEDQIPFLETAEEILFQYPYAGARDWLDVIEAGAPMSPYLGEVARHQGRLYRAKTSAGDVFVFEPETPIADMSIRVGGDDDAVPSLWTTPRTFSGATVIETGGERVSLLSVGKRFGMPERMVEEVDQRRRALPSDRVFVVHPGGAMPVDDAVDAVRSPVCAAVMASTNADVYVPNGNDLMRGVGPLLADSTVANMLVMTNLNPEGAAVTAPGADDSRLESQQISYRERITDDGLSVLVLGVVGASVLSKVPEQIRVTLNEQSPNDAVNAAIEAHRARRGRDADLVVVVSSGSAAEAAALTQLSDVDIVIGDFRRFDLAHRTEHIAIGTERGGREGIGRSSPIMVTRAGATSVGSVDVFFADNALTHAIHDTAPVTHHGIANATIAALTNAERDDERSSLVVLPDAVDFVDGNDALESLVFDARMIISGHIRSYGRDLPARYTDPLWMRMVTGIVRERLDVDVVAMRNLPRQSSITGPVLENIVEDWLPAVETLEVITLTGVDVQALASLVNNQEKDLARPGTDYIFLSGVDTSSLVVGGRPIGGALRYSVAVTSSLRALPDVAPILARAKDVSTRFTSTSNAHHRIAKSGVVLSVKSVVLTALQEAHADEGGALSSKNRARIARWLANDTASLSREWRLNVDELSATGSLYRNTTNIADFEGSRETRATTPNLFSFGLRLRTSTVLDGPLVAWEMGVRALYNAIILDLGDGAFPRNEALDDIVGHSELRLNRIRLSIDDGNYTILPFARVAIDSEFTPTVVASAPDTTYPHQALLQESVGVVAYLGSVVEELRLGVLIQEDFAEALVPGQAAFAGIHLDAGVMFGLRLKVPLWIFRFESETEGRYLAPDPDDRISDLALRVQSVQKLVVPLGDSFSVYAFADVFVVSGKLDVNRHLGASAIFGTGIEFRDAWRF